MCGVMGVVGVENAAQALYDGLLLLQHRGQDATGIVTTDGTAFFGQKGMGLVQDAFDERSMALLNGSSGVGHVRYPTAGLHLASETQPLYVNSPFGIVLAHNGNLINAEDLKEELFSQDLRQINTDSDSEVLLNVLAHALDKVARARNLHRPALLPEEIFFALGQAAERLKGAFAAVAMVAGHGLLAFRDAYGIRPLVLGARGVDAQKALQDLASGKRVFAQAWAVASESVALDALGFSRVMDVGAGEGVFVDFSSWAHKGRWAPAPCLSPCLFEYVYLARPDSVLDGVLVYGARVEMGRLLAEKIRPMLASLALDAVVPVPETARPIAWELARCLGLPYLEGLVKNRYIGRTFIMPSQGGRNRSVRRKLNPIAEIFSGKNVLLVDDSIVRGTTSKEIVRMAKEAGARKVVLASAAPPVRFPNVYGIDIPTRDELVAAHRTTDEIAQVLGADAVVYQDLEDLIAAVRSRNPALSSFETSCFNGQYATGDVDESYLLRLEKKKKLLHA